MRPRPMHRTGVLLTGYVEPILTSSSIQRLDIPRNLHNNEQDTGLEAGAVSISRLP